MNGFKGSSQKWLCVSLNVSQFAKLMWPKAISAIVRVPGAWHASATQRWPVGVGGGRRVGGGGEETR